MSCVYVCVLLGAAATTATVLPGTLTEEHTKRNPYKRNENKQLAAHKPSSAWHTHSVTQNGWTQQRRAYQQARTALQTCPLCSPSNCLKVFTTEELVRKH